MSLFKRKNKPSIDKGAGSSTDRSSGLDKDIAEASKGHGRSTSMVGDMKIGGLNTGRSTQIDSSSKKTKTKEEDAIKQKMPKLRNM